MRTSILEKHTFFETSIMKVVLISELFRNKSSKFFSSLDEWLLDNEKMLKQLGYTEASEFSILQNQISSLKLKDIQHKKRQQFLLSSECLEKAHLILIQLQEPIKTKIAQGKETIKQILTVIKEVPDFAKNKKEHFDTYIKRLWSKLKTDDQFKAICMQIRTVLPEIDVLRIIADEIEL
ncbi:hypothetical protein ACQY1Q_06410 [Tenacibaculum sp. TC6]|uniref:hypothetical protein n=1 Tax=Tenacibaculum sp. TC6 TaxID=3423223 RepID=UPI003D36F6B3